MFTSGDTVPSATSGTARSATNKDNKLHAPRLLTTGSRSATIRARSTAGPDLWGRQEPGHVRLGDAACRSATKTLWVATPASGLRLEERQRPDPASVTFDRIDNDPTAGPTPDRFASGRSASTRTTQNHAIVVSSGSNVKTPGTPGHVFDVYYIPGAVDVEAVDGNQPSDALGDIPATSSR